MHRLRIRLWHAKGNILSPVTLHFPQTRFQGKLCTVVQDMSFFVVLNLARIGTTA